MKIFVTGADGQLGMSLRRIGGRFAHHDFVFAARPQLDICDADSVRRIIGDSGAELIMNCAGYTHVDRAESEPDAAERINRDGVRNLADMAYGLGIPLIHVSTDYVFGGNRIGIPLTEDDRPDPRCVYGRTKLEGERAVSESGCDAAVIRTSWLYSESGHNFVRTMLRLGASGQRLRVVDDQTGCPTYAEDLARAMILMAERGIRGCGIYNFCNGGQTTWYGFAQEIFRQSGMDVPIDPVPTAEYPTAACRPAYSVLSTAKIRAAGIPVPEWREALGRCLERIRNLDKK